MRAVNPAHNQSDMYDRSVIVAGGFLRFLASKTGADVGGAPFDDKEGVGMRRDSSQ
jgi:hypothetical protein